MLNRIAQTRHASLHSYVTGSVEQDLQRLENGYGPIYADLTREDLGVPVMKAVLPGLAFFPEFDQFSTVSFRQFGHYWKVFS